MKKPMTAFRIETEKAPATSFKSNRYGQECYAEKGMIKTYSNFTQAQNKCDKLKAQGLNVAVRLMHPFLIIKVA